MRRASGLAGTDPRPACCSLSNMTHFTADNNSGLCGTVSVQGNAAYAPVTYQLGPCPTPVVSNVSSTPARGSSNTGAIAGTHRPGLVPASGPRCAQC